MIRNSDMEFYQFYQLKAEVWGILFEFVVLAKFRCIPYVLFSVFCNIRLWFIESLKYSRINVLYLGKQSNKQCSSVHPPSRNDIHKNYISYHVFQLGK